MASEIRAHGNPEKSVFAVIGKSSINDVGQLFSKTSEDTRNIGWTEILPTPTISPSPSVTPSKTPLVTRTPTPTPTLTRIVPTPSKSPSPTQTAAIGTSPTPTPTPTPTLFSIYIKYSVEAQTGGTAERTDGDSSGMIARNTGVMYVKATPSVGKAFLGWEVSPGTYANEPRSLSTKITGFTFFTPVTILAKFGDYLPTYQIDCVCNNSGEYEFTYINHEGLILTANGTGYYGGTIVPGAACGNSVVSIIKGASAYVIPYISCTTSIPYDAYIGNPGGSILFP